MSISDQVENMTEAEQQAAYEAWVKARENPENQRHDVDKLGVAELPYYRLNPPESEFCDYYFSLTVAVCGKHGHAPIGPPEYLQPDQHASCVLLGVNGTQGTRLVNVLLSADEALKLAESLTKQAKAVAP